MLLAVPGRLGILAALHLTDVAPQHRPVDRQHVDVVTLHLDLEHELARLLHRRRWRCFFAPISKRRGSAPSRIDPLPIELDHRHACAPSIVEPISIELDDRRTPVPTAVDPLSIELD